MLKCYLALFCPDMLVWNMWRHTRHSVVCLFDKGICCHLFYQCTTLMNNIQQHYLRNMQWCHFQIYVGASDVHVMSSLEPNICSNKWEDLFYISDFHRQCAVILFWWKMFFFFQKTIGSFSHYWLDFCMFGRERRIHSYGLFVCMCSQICFPESITLSNGLSNVIHRRKI